jgi:hypothetical protein
MTEKQKHELEVIRCRLFTDVLINVIQRSDPYTLICPTPSLAVKAAEEALAAFDKNFGTTK